MRLTFLRICVVLLLSISSAFTEETIEEGKYNVLVAFSQNVPSQNGMEIIENMKISLQDASKILHNAIGLQISKVTFEIPQSWNTSEWNVTVEDSFSSDNVKADILIDGTNDTAFGKFPFAQQYGSCGIQGHQIIVPTAFFDELNKFPKGTSLAREWLKYRYGVFDENGYFNDPLYPLYYRTPGNASEVHITDCTNFKIEYNFKDQDGNDCPSNKMLIDQLNSGDCRIDVSEEEIENVTSSFMYFQESISSMTHICGKDDDHEHNFPSPNKQNLLCYGKSIWDIVSKSSDFKNVDEEQEYVDPEFVFLKKANSTVVVAWENTEKMKSKGKIILNAITKLMTGLPDGSKFSAFSFGGNVPNVDYPLVELDGVTVRQTIALRIKSDFVKAEDGDYKAAIKKAYKILQTDARPQGNIIIITGTSDVLYVVLLKDINACSQILTSENSIFEESELPCLEVVQIPMADDAEKMYEKLTETMEKTYPSKVHDKVTEMVKIEYLKKDTSLKVEVDDLIEKVTFWVFSDKQGENFKLKLNDEIKTERKENTYGIVLELSYFPTQTGVIDFSFPYETDPILTEVQKTSKAGKYFAGTVTVHDTTNTDDTYQMPVIIYAIVRFGSYPVQNALVLATIQTPEGNVTELELNDDGKGDPDITKNDGVYSRYFTKFTGEGNYTVTVLVKNDGAGTRYGADGNAGYRTCCGSIVNGDSSLMNGDVPMLNDFSKVFETTFTAKSGRPEGGYKPSRITDLRIEEVTEDGILLKWTAPGGEADSGTAQSYEIKRFNSPKDANDDFDSGTKLIEYTASPSKRGETEELKISYDAFEESGLQYIAMKAKHSNITGDTSTIVQVNIPKKESKKEDETGGEKTKTSKTSPKIIGLVVGLIVGLLVLMILIYLVVYFVIVKPKKREQRKKESKENPVYEPSQRPESHTLNPISFVSADTLIKHHNEKVKAKTEKKEPPIFKEEDFEDKNVQRRNESDGSSKNQEQESSNKSLKNGPPFPPKSPKRITPV